MVIIILWCRVVYNSLWGGGSEGKNNSTGLIELIIVKVTCNVERRCKFSVGELRNL